MVQALLRDRAVSHRGELLQIEQFDFWFRPLRREIPISCLVSFARCSRSPSGLSDGAVLTSSTLESAKRASAHVAAGARRAGRDPGQDRGDDTPRVCGRIRTYRGPGSGSSQASPSTPGSSPLQPASGGERLRRGRPAIREAWQRGDRARAVSSSCPTRSWTRSRWSGRPPSCQERIAQYRDAGVALPMSPRAFATGAVERAVQKTIRACARRGEGGEVL